MSSPRSKLYRELRRKPLMFGQSYLAALTEPSRWACRPWADQVTFVCGSPHSGTSVTLRVIGEHPAVYAPMYESEAFLRAMPPWGMLRRLRCETVASGRRVLVEKTPDHLKHIEHIRRLVPGAQFIITIRDGRDVAASIAHRKHSPSSGVRRWQAAAAITAREVNAPDVLCLRYEDFVDDPIGYVRRICAFVGIPYLREMLDFHRHPVRYNGRDGKQKGTGVGGDHQRLRSWQINQPIFDGRGRWKHELSTEVAAAFNVGELGSLMRQFGYS